MGTYLALTQLIFANDAEGLRKRLADDASAVELLATEGYQALSGAASRGQTDVVRVFAELGICRGTDSVSGLTALSLARYFGHQEAAAILEKAGFCEADPAALMGMEIVAESGDPTETDFLNAVRRGQIEVARSMLERAPSIVNARQEGFEGTALHISIYFQHSSITVLLCASGADTSALDCDGNNALELAREWHVNEAIDILEKHEGSQARG